MNTLMSAVMNKQLPSGFVVIDGGDGWFYVEQANAIGQQAYGCGKNEKQAICDFYRQNPQYLGAI